MFKIIIKILINYNYYKYNYNIVNIEYEDALAEASGFQMPRQFRYMFGIYLPKPVFSHGQLYVAFSRARALGDVRVKVKDTDQQGKMQAKIVTKNTVCREVLS